jgi:hypothetical protein
MIFSGSRYANSGVFTLARPGAPSVQTLRLPLPGPPLNQGYYRRQSGQRLDLIANAFLTDATAFWRMCDANNALVPDALAASDLIGIPLVTE